MKVEKNKKEQTCVILTEDDFFDNSIIYGKSHRRYSEKALLQVRKAQFVVLFKEDGSTCVIKDRKGNPCIL